MRVGGVHARVQKGRCEVALVVVDVAARSVLGYSTHLAPAGEDDAGQLHELFIRAHELFNAQAAEAVVYWPPDPAPGGAGKRATLIKTARAEGAVLAAAGAVTSVDVVEKISGPGVRAASPDASDPVESLATQLADAPSDTPVRRAAAGALAWHLRR